MPNNIMGWTKEFKICVTSVETHFFKFLFFYSISATIIEILWSISDPELYYEEDIQKIRKKKR